jgi:hypothetical protein
MVLLILGAPMGGVRHYRANMEFKGNDPSLSGFALFSSVIRAKAPPSLAPGTLALSVCSASRGYRLDGQNLPEVVFRIGVRHASYLFLLIVALVMLACVGLWFHRACAGRKGLDCRVNTAAEKVSGAAADDAGDRQGNHRKRPFASIVELNAHFDQSVIDPPTSCMAKRSST